MPEALNGFQVSTAPPPELLAILHIVVTVQYSIMNPDQEAKFPLHEAAREGKSTSVAFWKYVT